MDSTQSGAADGGTIKEYRFKVPEGATELLILRHGESAAADPAVPFPLLAGHGDPELSPAGRWQAERLADRLAGEPISAVYVSSLRRTAQTAAPLADRLGITPVTEHDLREAHFGEWEGNVWRVRIVERHPVAMRMISEQRWDIVPGAEPAAAFAARVRGALNRIVSRHPGQTVAGSSARRSEMPAAASPSRSTPPTTPRYPSSFTSRGGGRSGASTTPPTYVKTQIEFEPKPSSTRPPGCLPSIEQFEATGSPAKARRPSCKSATRYAPIVN